MMLVLAVHHGWGVTFFGIKRGFLHTPIKDPVFAEPPEEYQGLIPGGVWDIWSGRSADRFRGALWQGGREADGCVSW